MNVIDGLPTDMTTLADRLALGMDLWGSYASWVWFVLAFWLMAGLSLWIYAAWRQYQSDQAYLAYVSRNLPILRRVAKQRAYEVGYSRRADRF